MPKCCLFLHFIVFLSNTNSSIRYKMSWMTQVCQRHGKVVII
ncbi:hypothetical protein GLYMA_19G201333v4 [Glycine max]|nr:hypothetical protein GLYMA_19G201333v4 [Glycine max]KAH1078758.1 hypothetical protein GYH30_053671 [Glycine max]